MQRQPKSFEPRVTDGISSRNLATAIQPECDYELTIRDSRLLDCTARKRERERQPGEASKDERAEFGKEAKERSYRWTERFSPDVGRVWSRLARGDNRSRDGGVFGAVFAPKGLATRRSPIVSSSARATNNAVQLGLADENVARWTFEARPIRPACMRAQWHNSTKSHRPPRSDFGPDFVSVFQFAWENNRHFLLITDHPRPPSPPPRPPRPPTTRQL